MTALLVALGAGPGAALRYLAAHHLDARMPWGTLVVNVLGSLLLGVCTGAALSGEALALVGTGFCGALTTWSGLAVGTVALGEDEAAPGRATAYALTTISLSLGACALGFVLGT